MRICSNNDSGHAETVKLEYDPQIISLSAILQHYFRIIDPTSVNRQGMTLDRNIEPHLLCQRSGQSGH
jgi:peptide methionine sulfoxide reductase MsrA